MLPGRATTKSQLHLISQKPAKTGSQQACVTAIAPTEICSSYRCAVGQLNALQPWFWQIALHTVQGCCAKQAHSMLVSLRLNLWRFALYTGVQWLSSNALQH